MSKRPSHHTARGTEDSEHNPLGGTNILGGYARRCPSFPSGRAVPENEGILSLTVAPLADTPMGWIFLSAAEQRSISIQVNTRLCGDRVGRSERGRGVHAKPAATGRRADPILCGARPGGDRALAVWLRRPPRGGPACSGERDHVSQGSRPR